MVLLSYFETNAHTLFCVTRKTPTLSASADKNFSPNPLSMYKYKY